ncbi:MAG: hypothetical protein CMH79_04220 [Nitrospinae bacterium]|nr:hypothetical protein [Nitrospinota bacterium]|tara:strand:+ start:609 stop:959 length:351 start_codon:yes stop_codon:yes gene_type:complete
MEGTFEKNYSFSKRLSESKNIINKYKNRIPVIVERHKDSQLPIGDKCKYLVPKDMNISQFIYFIRRTIQLEKVQTLFITINKQLIGSNKTMIDTYEEHKSDDGFLYVVYTNENTFG